MSEPGSLGAATLIRLVAAREISARVRDRNFILSSLVIVLVLVAILGLQVALNSGDDETRIGLLGDRADVVAAIEAQAAALDVAVDVTEFQSDSAARAAVEGEEVDGVLVPGVDGSELLVQQSADAALQAITQGAVSQVTLAEQLAAAGITEPAGNEVRVTALDPGADAEGQRVVIAMVGVGVLYSLLILFGQFVAQGVVEEKSSRVVELLLATMRPWQLLAGKILGLGLLGLVQIVAIAALGVTGALAFDLVDIPGELVGTAVSVVAWFVVGYAFYAAIFAVAASLVSRQEDLGTVLTPTTLILLGGFFVGLQASADPGGTLATVTSYVPGLSPLVMPVRQAAGEAAPWEVGLAVALMLAAIALVVRLGGRVYAGALLRTGGKTRIREALTAERA